MKQIILITLLFFSAQPIIKAQENTKPDFTWGNAAYINLNVGESFYYNQTEIKLIQIQNHYNLVKVGHDSLWMKVSRRTLPETIGEIRIFIADNKNVKTLTEDNEIHGLLTKDALLCISVNNQPLLDQNLFVFPISFNDGFVWKGEEDRHFFSYMGLQENNGKKYYRSHEGIDFDLNDAKGLEKHWIVAIENSTVIWVEEDKDDTENKQVSVLLESDSNPGIYYFYGNLYNRNLEVKRGQKVIRGELIGTAWGDNDRGFLHFSVIKCDTIPSNNPESFHVVNFFPQMYELYYRISMRFSKSFEKGTIKFGNKSVKNEDEKNNLAFEEYSGKGWLLGKWNVADKVPFVTKGESGNVRLNRILFVDTPAECRNPKNYFNYEINVRNGIYRIRAKVGDLNLPSWQKISFEGIDAGIISLEKGEFKWTSERIVKVTDAKLTLQISLNKTSITPAGISEIVFQKAD